MVDPLQWSGVGGVKLFIHLPEHGSQGAIHVHHFSSFVGEM